MQFLKKDESLLTTAIKIISIMWLFYVFYLWLIPPGTIGVMGNIVIKYDDITLGDLGSLISGIFAPLAFIWLFENFRQQNEMLQDTRRQLNILEDEKKNRRRITKANFSVNSISEGHTSGRNNTCVYMVKFTAEKKAEKIRMQLSSPFYFADLGSQAYLKTIQPNGEIKILIHAYEVEDLSIFLNQHILSITYLDIDGYDAIENFELIYLPDGFEGDALFAVYDKFNVIKIENSQDLPKTAIGLRN